MWPSVVLDQEINSYGNRECSNDTNNLLPIARKHAFDRELPFRPYRYGRQEPLAVFLPIAQRRDPLITTAWHRNDVLVVVWPFTKGLSQNGYVPGKSSFFDNRVAPYLGEQLVLG